MQHKPSTIIPPFAKNLPEFAPQNERHGNPRGLHETAGASFRSAVACVDDSALGILVFRHAKAVAAGLEIPVKFMHVMPPETSEIAPRDPIEWQLRQREARDHLSHILDSEPEGLAAKDQYLLNGIAGDEISRWAREHVGNLLVMATKCGSSKREAWGLEGQSSLGITVQKVLDESGASMLLVPPDQVSVDIVRYHRIMVPLDGSCRAESVLPFAVRIARNYGAELILAHVVPKPEILEPSLQDSAARNLLAELQKHNEKNARSYLDRLQTRLSSKDLTVTAVVESDGDARDRLAHIAADRRADLLVLSARGRGTLTDISCGNVARHIAAHTAVPALIIRHQIAGQKAGSQRYENQYNRHDRGIFWAPAH
ncbi:universal stress protein [Parasphingorhabdus sp.]|uniref:universal stress protein n=1 Tax=Parasphingorhabdus sp. TaxID=2709688 RepID=UPI003A947693